APWFVWANIATDQQLVEVFFWHHNVERGFGGTLAAHPWWFYAVRLPVDFLPWSLLLPAAVWRAMSRPDSVQGQAGSLPYGGLVWFFTVFVMLSLMRFKRADYLLPAFPGLALWLGGTIDAWLADELLPARSRLRRWAPVGLASLVAAAVVGWGVHV